MKRILFVDDEPMILAGLQNLLRKQRSKWEMFFVENGQAALDMLEKSAFDVIVSDMRMPKMDGAALLKQVQSRHPNVVRIVLSGHAELETALKSVSIAHQFLNKPCDASTLQSVVERACGLQALLSDELTRSAIGTIGKLPSVPSVYMAVTRALEDPAASVRDIAKLVEQDMAVSAKVLQLVNSAFFGLPQRMASVQPAVTYLGANMLKRVLLSVETFSMFENNSFGGLSLEAVQQHSMLVGAIASKLLKEKSKSEDAFTAGMLHDVGKLILAVHVPDRLKDAITEANANREPLHVAEYRLAGASHAEVGAYLLGLWGLPYTIVEAVAHHHQPSRIEHSSFEVLDAVFVAEALADELGPKKLQCLTARLDESYLQSLGALDRVDAFREKASEIIAGAK